MSDEGVNKEIITDCVHCWYHDLIEWRTEKYRKDIKPNPVEGCGTVGVNFTFFSFSNIKFLETGLIAKFDQQARL